MKSCKLVPALSSLRDTPAIHDLYPQFSGHLAFDIGANGGSVTRILADHFDDVVAVEPAESYGDLVADIPDNVRPLHAAVSETNGTVTLTETAKTSEIGELVTWSDKPITQTWGEKAGEREVRSVTLDFMAEMYGTPDFIKVDVEGHETQVVRSGHHLFSLHSPKLLIEVHDAAYGTEIRALLPAYDWKRYDHEGYRDGSQMRRNHYWISGRRDDGRRKTPRSGW